MTLHQQIHSAPTPIIDRSGIFRLNALLCEHRASESTDWKSKDDWAELAIEWHAMAYLAAKTNDEISQIDVAGNVDSLWPSAVRVCVDSV